MALILLPVIRVEIWHQPNKVALILLDGSWSRGKGPVAALQLSEVKSYEQ